MTCRAGEELKTEHCACHAVQTSAKGDLAAATRCHRDERIGLKIIRAGARVAMDVHCDAARALGAAEQIDSETAVGENRVAEDGVVDGSVAGDAYSDEIWSTTHGAVEGDDVARAGGRAAYRVVMTINLDADRVAQGLRACDIGADDVTLDDSALNRAAKSPTKVTIITRDEITWRRPRRGCQPADDIISVAGI